MIEGTRVLPEFTNRRKVILNKEVEICPGQLWWDKYHQWCKGSDDINICYLILSKDPVYLGSALYWRCALFQWCYVYSRYFGADANNWFTDEEIRKMILVGNILDIKGFKE